jgi:hypothetical protein
LSIADFRVAIGSRQSQIGNRKILSLIGGHVRLEKSFIHAIFPDGIGTWRFVQIREELVNDPTGEIQNPNPIQTPSPAKPAQGLSR